MDLKKRIKELIRNNDTLYMMARCINNRRDSEFVKLIKGYYEPYYDFVSVLISHNGEKYPENIIYHIRQYKPVNEKDNMRQTGGFCSNLYFTLQGLLFSDFFGLVPVIEWGTNSTYYDSGMDSITKNVFEYYFDPVSKIECSEIKECKNLIESRTPHERFFMESTHTYDVNQADIERLGYIYNKYIHLNQNTKEYIEKKINIIMDAGTVLAVHVRGTDFNQGFKNHPTAISLEEFLEKTKNVYSKGGYDKVFLATDDMNALKLFKKEFKDKLIYYSDVFRTEKHIGVQTIFNERPLHYYKLGLEILRDVYTLASCDSIICGLSYVSFAARFVNIALGRKYNEVIILNKGMNVKDSAEVKKYNHQKKKMSRKHNS